MRFYAGTAVLILKLKGELSGLRQFSATVSPLKMMKNAFYFTLKAFFVFKILQFLSWRFLSCRKTAWLEKLISKFMTSQPGKETTAVHIILNTLRSKDNQTIKFG